MPSFELILSVAVCISTFISTILLLLPSAYRQPESGNDATDKVKSRVQILVLGDIGRSPRMQYHAISVAKRGAFVDLIGYRGKKDNFRNENENGNIRAMLMMTGRQ